MNTETQFFFGGGGQTDVRAITLALVIVTSALLFCLPRRYAFIPLLITAILVPLDQQVVLAGLHITMSRVLICLGWCRLLAAALQHQRIIVALWNKIDMVFVLYCISNVVTYFVLWSGDSGALVNRLGFLYNACGIYFLARFFITKETDLTRVAKVLVWIFALVALGMTCEQLTGKNVFYVLGGVPPISVLREGKIRAQGPFVHPLTAGAIGATLIPLALGLWWVDKKQKWMALIGVIASVVMSITSRSSTALLTLAAGSVGISLWRCRRHLRALRWVIVLTLLVLHLVMKAPVWALLARIDLTGSSSGFHRYELVDQFIRRFSEWWLVGTRTTADWGWDMWDTINSYVAAGTSGGLLNFALFVAVFVIAFQQLGTRRKYAAQDPLLARQLWILGAMLFAHAVALFGIAYFDQSQFIWYTELALIGTAVAIDPVPLLDEEPAAVKNEADWISWDLYDAGAATASDPENSPATT